MKKRLLAMLLAVVTTISSVPTPVFAAADDAVVDYVDEETEAEAVEEVIPDEAEEVVVTEAPAEEADVTEENTEAAPAADEVVATDNFVDETAADVAAPAEETANEEAEGAVINKPDLVEEDAVAITNLLGNRGGVPAAQSLYGDQNYWFEEGEWDYEGGIADDKVFVAGFNNKAAADNTALWDVDPAVPATYKFSVASGWNKDDKSKLSFKEITPGSIIDVDGLQVSANSTWLRAVGDPAKIELVKDKDYYVDDDKAVWVYDSYGVGRKVGNAWVDSWRSADDYTNGYTWAGFKDGVWGNYSIYHNAKTNADGDEELVGEYFVYDWQHNTRGEDESRSYLYDPNGETGTIYYEEGAEIVKDDADNLYIIDDDGTRRLLTPNGSQDEETIGGVNYRVNRYRSATGDFDNYDWKRITVLRKAKQVDGNWEEFGQFYSEDRLKRTGINKNSLSIVSANKVGVYTVKAEISYTVSRNTATNGSGDTEIVKVTDVGYATFFVYTKLDENAGWNKINYELGGKKYVENINDFSKIAGLEAGAKYKVEWTVNGTPANNLYTADKNGEIKSDKYWAPKSNAALNLTKVSDKEANGNCDSAPRNIGLNTNGASYFDKSVFVEKTAPGLYGDKDQNNYNAAEKESVKIDGIYGDNKFLYMKQILGGGDYPAAGTTGGLAYTADAAKGTVDIYPLAAGITQLTADIQYATSNTNDGVEIKGASRTGDRTPIVLIVKEATPVGKIVGTRNATVRDEDGNVVFDDTMTPVTADFLEISDLEPGDYRLRSTSDNHIIKGALAGDADGDGIVNAAGTGTYAAVKDINGRWQDGLAANEISYVLVNSFAIKEDKVILEKVHYEGGVEFPALNATQEIVLSAEEIYVNIVPAMAGHTPVSTLDVEDGIQNPLYNLNYNVDATFNRGQKGNGLSVFYNVTDVKWDGELEKDGTFAKDKVYSATVKMSISSNATLSSNVAFRSDLTADKIHVNNGIWIGTDAYPKTGIYASGLNLALSSENISDVKAEGKNLTFKVTFPKAFIQYEVHYINVQDQLNGRRVVGDGGLADPVIYVAPGKKVTVTVDAVNKDGNRPSMPSISCNGNLNNAKILWEEFFYPRQNGNGILTDEENNKEYRFRTNDNGRTYSVDIYEANVYVETINDLSYDQFMAQYGNKYKVRNWNPLGSVPASVQFTISANAAATGEDKIQFTAQNGTVITKEIIIRYYKQAETPQPQIEYDRTVERIKGEPEVLDVITNLKPHTWYIIRWYNNNWGEYDSNSFYTSENPESKLANKGEIFVENDYWYISANREPITIREAYGEQPQKAASDPASLVIKQSIDYTDLYAGVNAPEEGANPDTNVNGMYTDKLWNSGVSVSPNSASWKDANGTELTNTDAYGAKGTQYNISFVVRINKYDFDENGNWNNVADYSHGETIYRGLNGVTMHVPGAVIANGKESVTQGLVNADDEGVVSVNAVFATSEAGKVPMWMVEVEADDATYEPAYDGNAYNDRSAAAYWGYAVSEGWGKAEGELRVNTGWRVLPTNAAYPEAVVYTDTTGSVNLSVSMNDAVGAGAKKTRAQISANKCVGEYANITSKIYNADGSVTDNIYVYNDVYVKLPAPYTANNTDDTNYISGLIKDEYYYAVAANGNGNADINWAFEDEYSGKAIEGLGANKNVTGFKRLATWPDFNGAVRNTVNIRRCYEEDPGSDFSSVDVTVTLSSRIQKKGLYVTWEYGATDDTGYYEYNGNKKEPVVWVWYDGTLLDDNYYTVVYKNNVNANVDSKKKATVYVKGKNGVKGKSNTMEFTIYPRDINNNTTTYSTDGIKNTVTLKKGTKLAKVKVNVYEWGVYNKALKAKKDYTLDSTTTQFNSDGWLLINGKGNYTGTKLVKVIVTDKIQKLKINLANKGKVEYSYYRDGLWNVKPSMTVTVGKTTKLTETLDYQIYVEGNAKKNGGGVHNVGTYKVYVIGQGIYGGKFVKKSFKITPKKLTDVQANIDEIASWAAGYQYDNIMGATLERGFSEGAKAAPELKIVADNVDLGYSYNSKKYVKAAVDSNWYGFTTNGYGYLQYTGKKAYDYMDNAYDVKPVDSVYVTYSKNKKLGTASYTIKFGGNFKGTKAIKGTFKVAETNLGWGGFNGSSTNVDQIVIPDVAYTGKAGTYYSNPMVYYENNTEGVWGATKVKQQTYKKNRDYTVRFYKDNARKDEITNKNKLELTPGQEYATVYVRIEGKGGYGLTTAGKAGYLNYSYRVYDPKKVQGGCVDLKTMKYYNGDAKPVKVKLQYTPSGYVVTSGSGKKLTTITNNTTDDSYNISQITRRSDKNPNTMVTLYGQDRTGINGKVVGLKNMKLTVKGTLEKEWFR